MLDIAYRLRRPPEHPPFAAVFRGDEADTDALVAGFARSLKERGWRVRGLVQSISGCASGCARGIVLRDLDGRSRYRISQNLGPGSVSCAIDAGRVAAAGVVLRRALADGVDLAVANRFGKLEAEGGGLAAEILALLSEGVPVLTIVADKYVEHLRQFSGDMSVLLAPRREALETWFASLNREEKCQ